MKDIYKNPNFYYVLVPAVLVIWPLWTWLIYLPTIKSRWLEDKKQYAEAQKMMGNILNLDPERLESSDSQNASAKFDYAAAIDKIAKGCGISATNYSISSKPIRVSSGQKTQSAMVILKQVDVTKFAKFLSSLQVRWANLQCEGVAIARQEGQPDSWKIDLDLKYYY